MLSYVGNVLAKVVMAKFWNPWIKIPNYAPVAIWIYYRERETKRISFICFDGTRLKKLSVLKAMQKVITSETFCMTLQTSTGFCNILPNY